MKNKVKTVWMKKSFNSSYSLFFNDQTVDQHWSVE